MIESEMIAEIRSWEGTKWVHGQAIKGRGTDCVQFLTKLGKTFGWVPEDYEMPVYNKDWALHNSQSVLKAELAKFCDPTSYPWKIGDILVFVFGLTASHAAIYIGDRLVVHAHIKKGVMCCKVEDLKDEKGRYQFDSVWRPRWQMLDKQ